MTDRPACRVRCADCDPSHAWWQPFPTSDAADRWMRAHTGQWGHDAFEVVGPVAKLTATSKTED